MVRRERQTGRDFARSFRTGLTETRPGWVTPVQGHETRRTSAKPPGEVDTKPSTWSASRLAASRAKAEAHRASRTEAQKTALAKAAEIYSNAGTTTEITGKEKRIIPNASPIDLRRASALIELANRNAA